MSAMFICLSFMFSGTHGYMAPEVIKKGVQYTFTADWFSLGCVIYKLLRGYAYNVWILYLTPVVCLCITGLLSLSILSLAVRHSPFRSQNKEEVDEMVLTKVRGTSFLCACFSFIFLCLAPHFDPSVIVCGFALFTGFLTRLN